MLWNQRAEAQDSEVLIEESAGLPTDMNSVMDEVVIDETIKGTYRDLKRVNKPVGGSSCAGKMLCLYLCKPEQDICNRGSYDLL